MVSGSAVPPDLTKTAPSVGTKISAMTNEEVSVAIRVSGRYFMNSPTTPGQNISGRKAASVVAVEAMTGQAMSFPASAEENGRATCWERVSEHGVVSVVAGAL